MAIGPPTGMRDWLPQETLLRQHLMETISAVYRLYGYLPIDTPVMEDLAVLLGKGGGENEKLLFKIMKRGEKLLHAQQENKDLADYGLRFDLTVPLARFVATHQGKLPKVFRRYHIAPVWRADRPQLGRYREFYQCDIDVVGGATSAYEIEIITATERVLEKLNLGKYRFRVSDKRLLPLLLTGFGVPQEHIGPITIVLDKLDKISFEEASSEIQKILTDHNSAATTLLDAVHYAIKTRVAVSSQLPTVLAFQDMWKGITDVTVRTDIERILGNIAHIIDSVQKITPASSVCFDPILVRGMDYYTGPVYEAVVEGFSSSVLGGGRYDGLIGRFLGKDIPAVGCSIGFERILAIKLQQASEREKPPYPRAILLRMDEDDLRLQQKAEQLRSAGIAVETILHREDLGKQLKYAQEVAKLKWAIKHVNDDFSLLVRELDRRQDHTFTVEEFKSRLTEH